jgi:imidazolonepropionase-like amidohydrolase
MTLANCHRSRALVLATLIAGCSSTGMTTIAEGVVIRDVNIVSTYSGAITPHMAVVIANGTIKQILSDTKVRLTGSATAIEATGKFVVPGFLNMHTHSILNANKPVTDWPLLVANGITGIREMAGAPPFIALAKQINSDSAAGKIDAPEIVAMAGTLVINADASQAQSIVQANQMMGADFIKMVRSTSDATLAILAAARSAAIPVAGHLSPSVSAVASSRAGWHSIEHLGAGEGILVDCSSDEDNIRAAVVDANPSVSITPRAALTTDPLLSVAAMQAPLYQQILDTYDASKCEAVTQAFIANDTWNVPTLVRLRNQELTADPDYQKDSNLIYVDPTTQALWLSSAAQWTAQVPMSVSMTYALYYAQQQELVKLLNQRGAKIMAGTDGGIWNVPGFSLHKEFRELAAAGLSPLEVLQATTLNGAEYLNRQSTMGSVDVGKNADLVILDGDPTVDVANLDLIWAVFLKGRYLSQAILQALKDGVANAYRLQTQSSFEALVDANDPD